METGTGRGDVCPGLYTLHVTLLCLFLCAGTQDLAEPSALCLHDQGNSDRHFRAAQANIWQSKDVVRFCNGMYGA